MYYLISRDNITVNMLFTENKKLIQNYIQVTLTSK